MKKITPIPTYESFKKSINKSININDVWSNLNRVDELMDEGVIEESSGELQISNEYFDSSGYPLLVNGNKIKSQAEIVNLIEYANKIKKCYDTDYSYNDVYTEINHLHDMLDRGVITNSKNLLTGDKNLIGDEDRAMIDRFNTCISKY